MTIRLWITILFGGLFALWFLALVEMRNGPLLSVLSVITIFGLVYAFMGWMGNWIGITLADRHIDEAGVWERGGESRKAEKSYEKAVVIYDSFLISSRAKQLNQKRVAGRIARFYLAKPEKNFASELFITSYLMLHPEDPQVAENWLRQMGSQREFSYKYQEIISRIGDAQPDNRAICLLLAKHCLSADRTDFAALQIYKQMLNIGNAKQKIMLASKLADLFANQGRADEWALEMYLKARRYGNGAHKILRGIAASVHWLPETASNRSMIVEARRHLSGMDKSALSSMSLEFNPPAGPEPSTKLSIFSRMITSMMGYGADLMEVVTGHLLQWIQIVYKKIPWKTGTVLKWITIVSVSSGSLFFLVNTAGHLFKSNIPENRPGESIGIITNDPFTIQVSAYLKKKHAEEYVKKLRGVNIDAFWEEARSKEKRWFQVRVSRFADKKSAKSYGESLKAKGIISDFYVANYKKKPE
jgi:hypothetical protein